MVSRPAPIVGRNLRGELVRFVLVGLIAVAIDFAVYRALLALSVPVQAAKAASFVAGAVFGYVANRAFTFRVDVQWRRMELARFACLYFSTLVANVTVNSLVLAVLGRSEWPIAVAFVAATAVSTVLNFLGMKFFVFSSSTNSAHGLEVPLASPAPTRGGSLPGQPRLSLVIPCYNEAANLPLLIGRLREVFVDDRIEVVLVDNGSSDATPTVLDELLRDQTLIRSVRVECNQGYGFGILTGLRSAHGEILGWTHADMQADPADALQALAMMDGAGDAAEFVKGRRYGRPATDVAFTIGMSAFETLLLRRPMWDINAQPTLFPRAFFESWRQPPHDFALDLYAYYQALRAGLRVSRFPVTFGARAHGVSHWNVNFSAKARFIRRTIDFSLRLRKEM